MSSSPTKFAPPSDQDVTRLVREYPFAWLVTMSPMDFAATPLPLIPRVDEHDSVIELRGHFARSIRVLHEPRPQPGPVRGSARLHFVIWLGDIPHRRGITRWCNTSWISDMEGRMRPMRWSANRSTCGARSTLHGPCLKWVLLGRASWWHRWFRGAHSRTARQIQARAGRREAENADITA
jgi:hypothetical protein